MTLSGLKSWAPAPAGVTAFLDHCFENFSISKSFLMATSWPDDADLRDLFHLAFVLCRDGEFLGLQ